jgi:protein phosphatase
MVLDCELMPWSAKAQGLLKNQYAAVGAAARTALMQTIESLDAAADRLPDAAVLLESARLRQTMTEKYVEAYRHYCWPVESLNDYKVAPFHLLASEGKVHLDRDHIWHMNTLARLAQVDDDLFLATPYRIVDLQEHEAFPSRLIRPTAGDAGPSPEGAVTTAMATEWWSELTNRGGEGMVVKPLEFVAQGRRGVVQPALKCRGSEYLRIIYGPEYLEPANLERLRNRSVRVKRSLAFREFALGVEALERFVRREPLRRIHECVFAVLALESEPVDPRL